ncbi:10303_t:CDS:2 [Dentiscutata heterogama]|uniref:10303_t:CDS:1 n=1 Tax=Dentiscutata heterogama TaxID=1316150 RepID=A0ACA9KSM7_9GLOM|nr:10303_t:CDS:2 [Dentiscutata heterogama]
MNIPKNDQPEFSNGYGSANIATIILNLFDIIDTTNQYPLHDIYNMDKTASICNLSEMKDIYKVNQLQTNIAWSEVSAKTIKRCWFYTKVISPCDENSVPIISPITNEDINDVKKTPPFDPNNELVVKEL